MKQKMKRWIGILLSLVMVLGVMPGMSLTAYAEDEYPLYVGGTQVTSAAPSGDGWSYNADSNTLTLNGFSYNGSGYSISEYEQVAIYYRGSDDLTISLSGTNAVTCTGNDGIYADNANIIISGSGSFTCNGSMVGIHSNKNITINGGTVTAGGGNFGISALGTFVVNGGTVVSNAPECDGINTGEMVVNGGSVTGNGRYSGIQIYPGNFTITGGTVTAIGGNGENESGIYVDSADINITGGVLKASGSIALTGTVKNAIAGTGWTDADGTEGKTAIAISTEGQTFSYKKVQFPAEEEKSTDAGIVVEPKDDVIYCESATGMSSEDIKFMPEAEGLSGDLKLAVTVSDISNTVSEAEKAQITEAVANMENGAQVAAFLDLSLYLRSEGAPEVRVTDLHGKELTMGFRVPVNMRAPAGVTRHFLALRLHGGKVDVVGESTTDVVPVKSGLFSTYALAYYDVKNSTGSSSSGGSDPCAHGHDYYLWTSPATATRDGRMAWVCWNCGHIDKTHFAEADEDGFVTLPAYPVFQKECIAAINKAQPGTLRIDANDWISFHRSVFEALEKRTDLSLVIDFHYEGKKYELTIPAGTTAEAALGEELYGGFMYLGSKYGLQER